MSNTKRDRADSTRTRSTSKVPAYEPAPGALATRAYIDAILDSCPALRGLRDTERPKYHAAIAGLVDRAYLLPEQYRHKFDDHCAVIEYAYRYRVLGHCSKRVKRVSAALFDELLGIAPSAKARSATGGYLRPAIRASLDRIAVPPHEPGAPIIDSRGRELPTRTRKQRRTPNAARASPARLPTTCRIKRDELPRFIAALDQCARHNESHGAATLPTDYRAELTGKFRDLRARCLVEAMASADDDDPHAKTQGRAATRAQERMAHWCGQTIAAAQRLNALATNGTVPLLFRESDAGRSYTVSVSGVNPQSTPRELRAVALDGFTEYDIEACNLTTMLRVAERHGLPCDAVRALVEDKAEARRDMAQVSGLPVAIVKEIITAIGTGAYVPNQREAREAWFDGPAFADPATGRTMRSPFCVLNLTGFTAFGRLACYLRKVWGETQRIGHTMIAQAPRTRDGRHLLNTLGLPIAASGKRGHRCRVIAHLQQGEEARAARALREVFDGVQLTIHDAIITLDCQDIAAGERAMREATGIPYRLSETVIGV